MKILILFILVIFLSSTLIGYSYGQAPREDPSLPQIHLQIVVRDSNGQLVAYVEPTVVYLRNVGWIHEYLDTKENKTLITIEGQIFEQIKYEQSWTQTRQRQIATMQMTYNGEVPLLFRHDGYIASPGDTIHTSWDIIRTVR